MQTRLYIGDLLDFTGFDATFVCFGGFEWSYV